MEAGYVDIIAGTGFLIKQDIWGTIDEQLHENSPELGAGLQDFVRDLTPIRTGALIMDISVESYPQPGGDDLVWVYAEDIAQEAYWNRVYVQYQEGGLLGLATYTNDPHEMFYGVATGEGLEYAQWWAEKTIGWANELLLSGAGVPWTNRLTP